MPTYEQCAISIVMHVLGLEPGIDPCIQGRRPRDDLQRRRLDARLGEAGHDRRRGSLLT